MRGRVLILTAILLLGLQPQALAGPVCSSSQLNQLLADTGLNVPEYGCDTLVELGVYRGFPVNARYVRGVVCHIGVNIFGLDGKEILPVHISEFVERYLLLMLTLSADEREKQMASDKVKIEGEISEMPKAGIEGYEISTQLLNDKDYILAINRNRTQILKITFPADCQLIFGMNKPEMESLFCFKTNTHRQHDYSNVGKEHNSLIRLSDDVYLDKRGEYLIDAMMQGFYFTRKDKEYLLVNDLSHPIYTIHNLLSEPSLSEGMTAEVSVSKYGFKKEIFDVPLSNLLDMCLRDGCVPYVGYSEFIPGQSVKAVLTMVNVAEGYNHIFEFSFTRDFLEEKTKQVSVCASVFVPTRNMENLYDDYNQKRHINDKNKRKLNIDNIDY